MSRAAPLALLARALLALVFFVAAGGAWAQKRVALLIGNSA